jgi:GT2 family glycosyltransferase
VNRTAKVSIAAVLVVYGQSDEMIRQAFEEVAGLSWKPITTYAVNNDVGRPIEVPSPSSLIAPRVNLGFCGGVNLAARQALLDGHTHLLILNLDVKILSSDLVSQLIGVFMRREDCAFVSPGISFWPQTERVWYRGGRILRPMWLARHPGIGRKWSNVTKSERKTDYFSGCCVLADLNVMMFSGGFDESLFMYYDEADLATQVAEKQHMYSYFLDAPLVAHAKEGRSFNVNEAYYHARNSRKLLDRYEVGVMHVCGAAAQLAVIPLQLLRCNSGEARRAYMQGFFRRSQHK